MDISHILAAFEIANAAHAHQRYGNQPYIAHPTAVFAETVTRFPTEWAMHEAAILHDAIEDAPPGFEVAPLIASRCGNHVLRLVQAITNEPGETRTERVSRTLSKIRDAGWQAAAIKVLDRLCNVRNSHQSSGLSPEDESKLQMYRKEYAEFRAALHPLTEHISELTSAWVELDTLLGSKDTPEKLTHREVCALIRDMGGREYPNRMVNGVRSFEMPRLQRVPDCTCNDRAPSIHINAFIDVIDAEGRTWPGRVEFEVCGEIGDERWVRILFYGCARNEVKQLYPDIYRVAQATWTAASNGLRHRRKTQE